MPFKNFQRRSMNMLLSVNGHINTANSKSKLVNRLISSCLSYDGISLLCGCSMLVQNVRSRKKPLFNSEALTPKTWCLPWMIKIAETSAITHTTAAAGKITWCPVFCIKPVIHGKNTPSNNKMDPVVQRTLIIHSVFRGWILLSAERIWPVEF